MTGKTAILVAERLSRIYRPGDVEVRALRQVSLRVEAGQMVCIMGRSGSGKSTLLRALGLIDRPDSGSIEIDGVDVTGLSDRRRARIRLARLGYVFQEYALLGELTALENVDLPALMLGGAVDPDRARGLLEMVGLGGRMAHRPKELSGGEQQRVAIARALVNEPAVVFADEPTANLDSASAGTVMETLHRLNRDLGVTILFVSHDPDDRAYAGRVVRLGDGMVLEGEGA